MRSGRHITIESAEEHSDDLRPEYDLEELLRNGVLGKYAAHCRRGSNAALLEPDVAEAFPTSEAVNAALLLVMQLAKLPRSKPEKPDPEGET
ncbi:MAG: hypothetical protein AB1646_07785 [Thermodesulfobacteriota bacterium]